jgi:ferredoxin
MAITKVWIEEGCIVCNACEAECPEVFHVTDTSCNVNGSVREDGVDSENREEMSVLSGSFGTDLEAAIEAGAAGCPVEVIKYEKA